MKEPSNAGASTSQGLCVVRHKLARSSASLCSRDHRGTDQGWKQYFIKSGLQRQHSSNIRTSPSSPQLSKMQKDAWHCPREN